MKSNKKEHIKVPAGSMLVDAKTILKITRKAAEPNFDNKETSPLIDYLIEIGLIDEDLFWEIVDEEW